MARKRKPEEARIREEAKARRGLARESRIDPKGDLRARREADQSRRYPQKDRSLQDVTPPLIRMGLPSTSDPECEYFSEDELDDIVKPIPHPTGKAYILMAMEMAGKEGAQFTDEDTRILYLDDGNVLTVAINTSSDLQDVFFALRRIWKYLGCGKSRRTNLKKAPEILESYREARKGKKAKSSTDEKRRKKAKELIQGEDFAKGKRIGRRVEKSDLPVKSCDECPDNVDCKYLKKLKLCPEMESYVAQDHVGRKEMLHQERSIEKD
jgi:hypothetical protein